MKFKEEVKTNMMLGLIFIIVIFGGLLIAQRNNQYDLEMQKKTEMSSTQISQNK